ncbi:replication protein A 70 kDa DNA-binding subunit-like isoform X2 [Bradysia coprophila]|uniref:replication protein A 70 kDa DNA-binding subunit-like isoform X1 n=1 Tax=Bradysia coprophila TaxID=38358 RepID=UPI00187DC299|nr:replication protein A 70 kDa DNA-binding subunit-like isoform X1 [Bradysia coprophila]XP_037043338.1 replication protein A 70 kDa DNA-binding subunit-like isoform X2 [Bradysia coprophila]
MENWKELEDDDGRSFVQYISENNDGQIVCMACAKPIANKDDSGGIEKIYSHTRSIEHGFKLFVMLNLSVEVVDLCDDRVDRPSKPKEKSLQITRNATDSTLIVSGLDVIKYVIPIVDLPYLKTKIYDRDPIRKTVMSLDNYVTKSNSSSKRKSSEEEADNQVTPKKRKTSQLTLERWCVQNKENQQVNSSVIESPQKIQSVTQTTFPSSEGLTRISDVRPAKRGISQIIRARVTLKSDIHPFFNFLGPTTMFTMDIVDESGEMRASAFGASVDKLYDLVEVDRIYYISKFKVKLSDPTKTPHISEYNITCNEETIIRPCILGPFQIPRLKFNFQPISNVEHMTKDDIIDVIAICESFTEVENKRLANGVQGRCRGIWLVDQSATKIMLYIWGSNADNFEANRPGDVIAVKRAKVKTFAKLNLDSSCLSSSTFQINPKLPEADALRTWYSRKENVAMKVLSGIPRAKKINASK